jgi:hypothetical protein
MIMHAKASEGVRWLSLKIPFIAAPGHALCNVDAGVQDHATCNGILAHEDGSEQLSSFPLPTRVSYHHVRLFAASETANVMRRTVTAAQRTRGMCMVLLAAENDRALLRLVPRFREVLQEFEGELKAKKNGVWQKRCA